MPAVWSSEVATFALSAFFVVVAGHGYVRALGRERRARLAAVAATAFVSALVAGTAAARLASPTAELTDATLLVYEAALCVLAVALLTGLVVEPWARTKVADLVVDLRQAGSGTLRDALAQALGDPTLEIGYWLDRGYVDSEGRSLALPAEGSVRKVTRVDQDGKPIAVLVHDAAVLDDPGLSDALARAARLAAANARLQAEVRTQLDELAESRRRLVHAGDEERRRLERRLHETVEGRLTALADRLEDAERAAADTAHLSRVRQQLDRALAELHDLATGLHPGGIEEGGLGAALASLAARSPVPVDLRVTEVSMPEELERATYFVCSEALANITKYANASSAVISVGERAERLHVEISRRRRRRRGARRRQWTLRARRSRRGARRDVPARQPPGGWDAIVRRAAAPGSDPLTACQGMSRTGGPTRRQDDAPAHTTASPGFIGGSGSSWIVPSASRENSKVRVSPPQSNTRWLPTIS